MVVHSINKTIKKVVSECYGTIFTTQKPCLMSSVITSHFWQHSPSRRAVSIFLSFQTIVAIFVIISSTISSVKVGIVPHTPSKRN